MCAVDGKGRMAGGGGGWVTLATLTGCNNRLQKVGISPLVYS